MAGMGCKSIVHCSMLFFTTSLCPPNLKPKGKSAKVRAVYLAAVDLPLAGYR